ncbi:PREDICTED: uncharacterized protein LOC109206595 [Nicotiana attenuata]|uniref:uncharacterized protein LOC109206595 n=1 Tax=Nicotiana attenuata TaxID=49451 RepID=UPI000905A4FC|nr:PREDICTED: uncharacterized protein LOC109206595 [Nicotiana attenuata]
MALTHPFTAVDVANKYWKRVHTLHGTPESIVSDRDMILLSNFWQALFKLKRTQLLYSSAYHPWTDGQTERRQQMQQLLKDNLQKAQERMKLYTDQKRTERAFQVGDMAYLSRAGQVAYKLLLPPTSKVHHVFHVSLLKKKIGSRAVVQSVLPMTSEEGQFLVKPVAILQRHLVQKGNVAAIKICNPAMGF